MRNCIIGIIGLFFCMPGFGQNDFTQIGTNTDTMQISSTIVGSSVIQTDSGLAKSDFEQSDIELPHSQDSNLTNAGIIKGIVQDGNSHAALSGVKIYVAGKPEPVILSNKDGSFSIPYDTSGNYNLTFSFSVYTPDTLQVTTSGKETTIPIVYLWDPLKNLSRTVHGYSDGQASSLKKQKNSDNFKNVVSSELIEKLPDQTVADALQRLPGVSVQREQGEGRYIQIRGTEPRLSTVTINGQSMGSTDGKTRSAGLNVIPSDQLAEIEVSKVLTPEMDGDAIGGTVNLVTATAKDTSLAIKLNITPGYSALSKTPIYQGSASIGKRFLAKGALGIIFGGSYMKSTKETDGLVLHWDTTVYKTLDYNPNLKACGFLTELQWRQTDKISERYGVSGKLDYRFSPLTKAFISASYNDYSTEELRRSLAFGIGESVAAVEESNFFVVRYVPTTRTIRDRVRKQAMSNVTLGGTGKILDAKIDGTISFSNATNNEPDRLTMAFQRDSYIKYSVDDPDNPTFFPFDISTYIWSNLRPPKIPVFVLDTTYDFMAGYTSRSISIQNRSADETSLTGQLNMSLPFDWDTRDGEIKAGIKGTEHTKKQTVRQITFVQLIGGKTVDQQLSNFLDDYANNNFYNGHDTLNNMPDPHKIKTFLDTASNIIRSDTLPEDLLKNPENYTARDRNGAGYLQGKLKIDRLLIVGGLRLEYTSMYYAGYTDTLINNIKKQSPIEMYRSFMFGLPMILAKYSLTPDLFYRVSYTRSFSRPDWFDLLPRSVESFDDATGHSTVEKGNPDLRPTTSHNIDISIEWYNSFSSLWSGEVFFKQMEDYIFSVSQDIRIEGSKETKTAFFKDNGGSARLAGAGLAIQQQFTRLPGFLSGFGVNGNYSWTWSETQVPGFLKSSPIPGQSEHVANGALFYEKYGFNARAALNYQSKFITEIGVFSYREVSNFQFTYVDNHLQLDCSVSQKIGKYCTIMAEFTNLTNEPYKLYLGDTKHTVQKEYYSWSAQGGIRLAF